MLAPCDTVKIKITIFFKIPASFTSLSSTNLQLHQTSCIIELMSELTPQSMRPPSKLIWDQGYHSQHMLSQSMFEIQTNRRIYLTKRNNSGTLIKSDNFFFKFTTDSRKWRWVKMKTSRNVSGYASTIYVNSHARMLWNKKLHWFLFATYVKSEIIIRIIVDKTGRTVEVQQKLSLTQRKARRKL